MLNEKTVYNKVYVTFAERAEMGMNTSVSAASRFWINFLKTAGILLLCTLISIGFKHLESVREENILMVYLTGVLLVNISTKGYGWGFFSSVVCVFAFNFFFTDPVWTFLVSDPNYIITFLIFLVISTLTGTLAKRLQQHADTAKRNERQARRLYEISKRYLNLTSVEEIALHALKILSEYQYRCILYLESDDKDGQGLRVVSFDGEDAKVADMNRDLAKWCFSHKEACGCGTGHYKNSSWQFTPLQSSNHVLGVASFYRGDQKWSEDRSLFLNTVLSQAAMAIEREQLRLQQEEIRMEIEKEKLRSNLLRSISHDLRTPLTGIAGSTSFLMESFGELDRDTVKSLLSDITNDAMWLNNMVENLLNMTRIQDGRLLIQKQDEVVDDIVSEACGRAAKQQREHRLSIQMPDELLLVPMDGRLMVQVLVNLLDNAFQHTKPDSQILLRVFRQKNEAVFEVSDNGGGIDPTLLPHIFESFVSSRTEKSDSSRGVGLGLSICKSVIEAHGGRITAQNNAHGGATFRFTLPLDKEAQPDE